MTIKKISLLILFLMLTNCGYDAIYSKKNNLNILVNKIETSGNKNINRIIVSSIKVEEEKKGQNPAFDPLFVHVQHFMGGVVYSP